MDKRKLIEAGINYDEGVERFGGRAESFEKYLVKLFDGDHMSVMERQLKDRDIQSAFRTAHDLKSIIGNLSLDCCYEAVCELTELLRGGDTRTDYENAFAKAQYWYEKAHSAVMEGKT